MTIDTILAGSKNDVYEYLMDTFQNKKVSYYVEMMENVLVKRNQIINKISYRVGYKESHIILFNDEKVCNYRKIEVI